MFKEQEPGNKVAHNEAEAEEKYTWSQEIEITGEKLVDRVKELIAEGNVRRLILRHSDNTVLIEVPLTAGVAVGGAVALFAPALAAIGAIAALVTHLKLEIVRVENIDKDRFGND